MAYRTRIASVICAVVVRKFGPVFCMSVFFVKAIRKSTLTLLSLFLVSFFKVTLEVEVAERSSALNHRPGFSSSTIVSINSGSGFVAHPKGSYQVGNSAITSECQ